MPWSHRERYVRTMREPNRLAPPAMRDKRRWSEMEDQDLMRRWPRATRKERVAIAVNMGRSFVACTRHYTILRKRYNSQTKAVDN